MSLNENLGIPDARAREISKKFSTVMRPIFEKGELTESGSLEIIMGMNLELTETERLWLAYHVGGINRMMLYAKENAKQVIINW
jgi:hypothetical protein